MAAPACAMPAREILGSAEPVVIIAVLAGQGYRIKRLSGEIIFHFSLEELDGAVEQRNRSLFAFH
jgi:hypothetical protein